LYGQLIDRCPQAAGMGRSKVGRLTWSLVLYLYLYREPWRWLQCELDGRERQRADRFN
jgi:hypothetical protein